MVLIYIPGRLGLSTVRDLDVYTYIQQEPLFTFSLQVFISLG